MKNSFLLFFSICCLSFIACSDDDGGTCSGNTSPIAISVEGVTMSNITGTASESTDRLSINIGGNSDNDATVFFSCPNILGAYDLNFGDTDPQTVTAFVPDGNLNVILTSGCFDIVSIDSSNVVMRFDIDEDGTSLDGEISLSVN